MVPYLHPDRLRGRVHFSYYVILHQCQLEYLSYFNLKIYTFSMMSYGSSFTIVATIFFPILRWTVSTMISNKIPNSCIFKSDQQHRRNTPNEPSEIGHWHSHWPVYSDFSFRNMHIVFMRLYHQLHTYCNVYVLDYFMYVCERTHPSQGWTCGGALIKATICIWNTFGYF